MWISFPVSTSAGGSAYAPPCRILLTLLRLPFRQSANLAVGGSPRQENRTHVRRPGLDHSQGLRRLRQKDNARHGLKSTTRKARSSESGVPRDGAGGQLAAWSHRLALAIALGAPVFFVPPLLILLARAKSTQSQKGNPRMPRTTCMKKRTQVSTQPQQEVTAR